MFLRFIWSFMPIALFSFMPVIMIPDPKMEIEEQVEGNYSIWGSDDTPPRGRRNLFWWRTFPTIKSSGIYLSFYFCFSLVVLFMVLGSTLFPNLWIFPSIVMFLADLPAKVPNGVMYGQEKGGRALLWHSSKASYRWSPLLLGRSQFHNRGIFEGFN